MECTHNTILANPLIAGWPNSAEHSPLACLNIISQRHITTEQYHRPSPLNISGSKKLGTHKTNHYHLQKSRRKKEKKIKNWSLAVQANRNPNHHSEGIKYIGIPVPDIVLNPEIAELDDSSWFRDGTEINTWAWLDLMTVTPPMLLIIPGIPLTGFPRTGARKPTHHLFFFPLAERWNLWRTFDQKRNLWRTGLEKDGRTERERENRERKRERGGERGHHNQQWSTASDREMTRLFLHLFSTKIRNQETK